MTLVVKMDQKYRSPKDSTKDSAARTSSCSGQLESKGGEAEALGQEKVSLLVTSNQRTLAPAFGRFRFPGFPGARVRERVGVLRVLCRGMREGWVLLAKKICDWLKLCRGVPWPSPQG